MLADQCFGGIEVMHALHVKTVGMFLESAEEGSKLFVHQHELRWLVCGQVQPVQAGKGKVAVLILHALQLGEAGPQLHARNLQIGHDGIQFEFVLDLVKAVEIHLEDFDEEAALLKEKRGLSNGLHTFADQVLGMRKFAMGGDEQNVLEANLDLTDILGDDQADIANGAIPVPEGEKIPYAIIREPVIPEKAGEAAKSQDEQEKYMGDDRFFDETEAAQHECKALIN